MAHLLVSRFMTVLQVYIGPLHTLAQGHLMMNRRSTRLLPVLDEGRPIGLVRMGDLHLVETRRNVDPEQVPSEEAVCSDPLTVGPEQTVAAVAGQMAERRIGTAVVMDGENVVGMFTTGDALRALGAVVRGGG